MIIMKIKGRVPAWLPYFAVLYYTDILFLIPRAGYLAGKPATVALALILSVLWTIHVIALYYRKEINRKIHLIVMEVDFAFRLPFVLNFFLTDDPVRWYDAVSLVINLAVILSALVFIFFLTDSDVRKLYSGRNAA